jgi:hypothetical protein
MSRMMVPSADALGNVKDLDAANRRYVDRLADLPFPGLSSNCDHPVRNMS